MQLVSPVLIIDEHETDSYRHYVFSTPRPAACGILLADAARHMAKAIAQQTGAEYGEALHEMVDLFSKEMNRPTSILEGGTPK